MNYRSIRNFYSVILQACLLGPFLTSAAWGQIPFSCIGETYIVQDVDARLNRIDQSTSPFTLLQIGGTTGTEINNIGFRGSDRLLYGLELSPTGNVQVLQIDSTGAVFGLGAATGLPPEVRFDAGDISVDGDILYAHAANQPLYAIDLTTTPLTATSVAVDGDGGLVFDWATNPADGLLYGGDSSHGQIARLDPTTGLRTDLALPGLPAGTAFGGAWFGASGHLFLYQNDGFIFEIDLAGPTLLGTRSGISSSRNDAAACVQNTVGAAKQMISTRDGLPENLTIDYVFENFSAAQNLQNLTAVDDLAAVFGIHGVDWTFTFLASNPADFANPDFDGHLETDLIAPGQSLDAGASALITVEIQILTRDNVDTQGDFCNQILVTGETAGGAAFGDFSTAGLEPDPNSDGSPEERQQTCVNLGQAIFPCTGEAFIIQNFDAELTLVDQTTAPFAFVPIGDATGREINNLGFRRSDGLLYAVELARRGNEQIIQIDSTGTVFGLGRPTGLPSDVRFDAGDVSTDGDTMFLTANNRPLYLVDLTASPLTAVERPITGATGLVFDWAHHPDNGLLYGGDRTHGQLAILNPITGIRTDVPLPGLPAGAPFGGAWFDASRRLFLYRNTGTLYEIDLAGPTIVATSSGPGSNRNDGAACVPEDSNIQPTAAFTADPASGDAALLVNFDASPSDDTDGTLVSYVWDFGDGVSASGPTTSHVFSDPGTFAVSLLVTDDDGATDAASQTVTVLPTLTITAPEPGTVTSEATIDVAGVYAGTLDSIAVNGIVADLTAPGDQGGNFSATVPITEGTNRLVATAINPSGATASTSIIVRRDTVAPQVVIETPGDLDRLPAATVTVAGTVSDIIPGATTNDDDVTVTVNGFTAAVTNRAFIVADLPLQAGANTITAEATDLAGNTGSTSILVSYEENLPGIRIVARSETDNQSARIFEPIPEPLTVQVTDGSGQPLSGRPVTFTVSRGDGVLGSPLVRQITVLTDSGGEARTDFNVGSRTGVGIHRVRATTPGSLVETEFCLTALSGSPQTLAVHRPPTIRGLAGQPLADLLSVIVTDEGGNPLPGIDVTFRVDLGDGHFDGQPSQIVTTDADGIARVSWTLDAVPGPNLASATYEDLEFPISFRASGFRTGPVELTRISGVVQNSVGQPITNVPVVLRDTTLQATTGSDGRFSIANVTPGNYHVGILGLQQDPADVFPYPDIEFVIEAIAGVDNQLDQVVVLPFLDDVQLVGGDEDVTLGMAGVPGFAIKILARSTFLPDGRQEPLLMSSSQVKIDKLPMEPPQGAAPLVVGTLQPGGIRFDPPAQVIYPNADGLSPGDVADVFAFHHDIGEFVNIGPATVTEDGDVVASDPGFGIVESGWHCLIRRPSAPSACSNRCGDVIQWKQGPANRGTEAPVTLQKQLGPAQLFIRFTPAGTYVDPQWSGGPPAVELGTGTTFGPGFSRILLRPEECGTIDLLSPTYQPTGFTPPLTCQLQIPVEVGEPGCTHLAPPVERSLSLNKGEPEPLDLDETCTVTVGNRTATVNALGNFLVTNVPATRIGASNIPQLYRVRATCLRDGEMITGQSDFFPLTPGRTSFIPNSVAEDGSDLGTGILPGELDPIPRQIRVTAPTTSLNLGDTTQLVVTATLPDGSTEDRTPRAKGTTYLSTNRNYLTVTQEGLVTAINESTSTRQVLVFVANEGNITTIAIDVVPPSNDTDGDGMPNDWELLYGLDPEDPADADGDLDGDGKTNLEEFLDGTIPTIADTDGDGIPDGLDTIPLRPIEVRPDTQAPGPGDASPSDTFGSTAAIDGGILVGGAPGDDGASGSAYVFELGAGGAEDWDQVAKAVAGDGQPDDRFGAAVSLDGPILAVGAPGSDALAIDAGAVYVFERNAGGQWNQIATLTAGSAGDAFGNAVALFGNRLVVGAPGDDGEGVNAGAIYVFERDAGGAWSQTDRLVASDASDGDRLGESVARSGGEILVGAPGEDAGATDSGAAYLYANVSGSWDEIIKLKAADAATGDSFGFSVALEDGTAVVGAYFDEHVDFAAGSVYVFTRNDTGTWGQADKLTATDAGFGDFFGFAVAIDAGKIVVGAPFDQNAGAFSGSAYVFEPDITGDWSETFKLVATGTADLDRFGTAVAISGDTVVVGAPLADPSGDDSGSVYLFDIAFGAVP